MKVKILLITYIHGSIPTYIMCFLPLSSYKLIQIHSKKSVTISKTNNLTGSKRHSKYLASMLKANGK